MPLFFFDQTLFSIDVDLAVLNPGFSIGVADHHLPYRSRQ